jgi:hypothetical protein
MFAVAESRNGSVFSMGIAPSAGLLFADRDIDDDDVINIFDDLDNAEGVGGDPSSCQQTETIRPGPVKLQKQGLRRLFHHRQGEVEKHEEVEDKEACSYFVTVFVTMLYII